VVDAPLVAEAHCINELEKHLSDEGIVLTENASVNGVKEVSARGQLEDDE
jgi:hypothetical protein